jgi:hypothetical protein
MVMTTAATRTRLHRTSMRPVKELAGAPERGLTSKESSVVARENRTKTTASNIDGSVRKTSGLLHGVQAAFLSALSHVLIVSGFEAVLAVQSTGKRIQRRIVMKKVVTWKLSAQNIKSKPNNIVFLIPEW